MKVALEPQAGAPCSDPANLAQNGREGGFKGTISMAAVVAICCANHCGTENNPVDTDIIRAYSPLFSNHGGEPCTFYHARVDAAPLALCCSTCWGTGAFFSRLAAVFGR